MANNRMWIRCKACGDGHFFAKSMGGPWYQWVGSVDEEFFAEHQACSGDPSDDTGFELAYEHMPEGREHEEMRGGTWRSNR